MHPIRVVGVALVPLVACFGSSGGSPQGDGGPDAPGTDASGPGEGGAAEASPACAAPTGAGTMHGGSVAQAETWTEAGSPYLLPYDTEITAALTVGPCVHVLIGAGKTITVATGGSIVANGDASRPVYFDPKDSAAWASIRALDGGTLGFTNVQIRGGGDPLNTIVDFTGMLDIRADQTKPPAEVLSAHGLTLTGSMGQGLYMHESGGFSVDSTAVTIQQSKGYPIHASANLAGTIPKGSTLTGNGTDEILLSGSGAGLSIASWDVTFADLGVPYHVGASSEEGRLDVGAMTGTVTLTVDPGVTVRFKKGGALYIDYAHGTAPATGALIAAGTQQKPIVFTSAEAAPAAGDWLGIGFGDVPSVTDRLDFVTVAYAGGASTSGSSSCPYPGNPPPNSDAAVRIFGPPASAFITHSAVTDSLSNGIDRGWAADNLTDFLTDGTNTFARVARCWETYPKDMNNGGCPATVPCPM